MSRPSPTDVLFDSRRKSHREMYPRDRARVYTPYVDESGRRRFYQTQTVYDDYGGANMFPAVYGERLDPTYGAFNKTMTAFRKHTAQQKQIARSVKEARPAYTRKAQTTLRWMLPDETTYKTVPRFPTVEGSGEMVTIDMYVPELAGLKVGIRGANSYMEDNPRTVWRITTGDVTIGYRDTSDGGEEFGLTLYTDDEATPIQSWTNNIYMVCISDDHYVPKKLKFLKGYLAKVGTYQDESREARKFHRYYRMFNPDPIVRSQHGL